VAKLDQNTNYFASMTDMMVGILFVFIIMLAYFAFQIQSEEAVPKPIYDEVLDQRDEAQRQVRALESEVLALQGQITELTAQLKQKEKDIEKLNDEIAALRKRISALEDEVEDLTKEIEQLKKQIKDLEEQLKNALKPNPLLEFIEESAQARDNIVESVVDELRDAGIDAQANTQQGVVTISGEGLFLSSRSDLESKEGAVEKVNAISNAILRNIECFALNGKELTPPSCGGPGALLESVYIEGHTDKVPIPEGRTLLDGSRTNLELSARRASNTYEQVVTHNDNIVEFRNPAGQQILSVAAYGPQRPIDEADTNEAYAKNRRIDIRFVMYVPENEAQLAQLKESLAK